MRAYKRISEKMMNERLEVVRDGKRFPTVWSFEKFIENSWHFDMTQVSDAAWLRLERYHAARGKEKRQRHKMQLIRALVLCMGWVPILGRLQYDEQLLRATLYEKDGKVSQFFEPSLMPFCELLARMERERERQKSERMKKIIQIRKKTLQREASKASRSAVV